VPEKQTAQPDQIRAELQRILGFKDMKSSRQLSRFLEFVIEESLAGRESRIKERSIAIGALERDEDFDPRFDAIVRIVAGKLRRTLERYYQSDGASDELRITIPKGTYVPRVAPMDAEPPPEQQPAPTGPIVDLVQTKLHRPPVTADFVRLPALLERLSRHAHLPLTLVSAPAGYGKTTLLSAWLDECEMPSAWLALDDDDNDLRRFLLGVVSAIRTIHPDAAEATMAMLTARRLPSERALGHQLLNDLAAIAEPFVLVLDDYHLIHERAVDEVMELVLQHPSNSLHLVLLTRADPRLPIERLRGRGQIEQLSTFDLRFTPKETAEFLNQLLGVILSDSVAGHVAERTDGWPAGLRLLAFSLRGHPDPSEALREMSGEVTAVTDYLVSEVMERLPHAISSRLLRLSVVDRFCESLCDTFDLRFETHPQEDEESQSLIGWLLANNLFLISLDAERRWYRFHHLFQSLLQEQLRQRCGEDEIAAIHACASDWFEAQGLIDDAIDHAVRAGRLEDAADIVERARHKELNRDRVYVVRRWLDKLPHEIKGRRPGLLLAEAWVLGDQFRMEEIPPLLERAELLMAKEPAEKLLVSELNLHRGVILFFGGDAKSARVCLELGKQHVSTSHQLTAGELELHLALARQATGQADVAMEAAEQAIRDADADAFVLLSRLLAVPAMIHLLSGETIAAAGAARRFRYMFERTEIPAAEAWAHYLYGISNLQSGKLDEAREAFGFAADRRAVLHLQAALDAQAALVLANEAAGRSDDATRALDRLFRFAAETNGGQGVLMADSCRARLALLRGDSRSALEWARSTHPDVDVPGMVFWVEVPTVTRARILAAVGSAEELEGAIDLLVSLRRGLEDVHNTFQSIEIGVLQAIALQRQGRREAAIEALEHTLTLAEPGGWIRPFVELGPPMADLLDTLVEDGRGGEGARLMRSRLREQQGTSARDPVDLVSDDSNPKARS
jgi:LuxR family maltose regulon positive regulatory protein